MKKGMPTISYRPGSWAKSVLPLEARPNLSFNTMGLSTPFSQYISDNLPAGTSFLEIFEFFSRTMYSDTRV